MNSAPGLTTVAQFRELPQLSVRRELVRGSVRTIDFADAEHGAVTGNLSWLLGRTVVPEKLGCIYAAGTGFILAHDPDTIRGADISYIREARVHAVSEDEDYISVAPDLVAEVVSESDDEVDAAERIAEWLAFGVPLLWSVRPKTRTVTVYRPGMEPFVLRDTDTLDGGVVVPGFRCRVAEIFE